MPRAFSHNPNHRITEKSRPTRDEVSAGIAQLALLCLLAAAGSPTVRRGVASGDKLFVWLTAGAAAALAGLLYYRRRRAGPDEIDGTLSDQRANGGSSTVRTSKSNPIIKELRNADWFQFQRYLAAVYTKLQYTVTTPGRPNPESALNLIIEKDGQRLAVHCRHWKSLNVGVRAIREFSGAMTHGGFEKGIFVSLGGYSEHARKVAERHGIQVVDETELTSLLDSADLTSSPEIAEILKQKICPKCQSEMLPRTAKKTDQIEINFWGCSNPQCDQTIPA